jgi:hypothetical protein
MSKHVDPVSASELYTLYAELHLTCGRAAAALRLSGNWDVPHDEMLERFHKEEALAEEIWQRIKALRNGR